MRFQQGHPIIIGLSGEAGTGKTVTADTLVPQGAVRMTDLYWWDHKYLAMPLYEMVSIKRDISGERADERIRHELHMVLHDLFGKSILYGLPDYDELVELVYDISAMPMDMSGKKPRSFLQDAASLCRAIDKDVFAKWVVRALKRDNAWATENEKQYVGIVSDIRMPNEAKAIINQPNGIVIRLTASEHVRHERLLDRDGQLMTAKQQSHESERVKDIPNEFISHTLDTDDLSIKDQAQLVLKVSSKLLGIELQNTTSPGEQVHAQA